MYEKYTKQHLRRFPKTELILRGVNFKSYSIVVFALIGCEAHEEQRSQLHALVDVGDGFQCRRQWPDSAKGGWSKVTIAPVGPGEGGAGRGSGNGDLYQAQLLRGVLFVHNRVGAATRIRRREAVSGRACPVRWQRWRPLAPPALM